MRPFFDNGSDLFRLRELGRAWIGTPFCQNSAVRGQGVSCHMLVAAVLEETGALPPRQYLQGCPGGARAKRRRTMEAWIDENLPELAASTEPVAAGDVVTFTFGHIGLLIPGERGKIELLHALADNGARVDDFMDATWLAKVSRCWRPMAPLV